MPITGSGKFDSEYDEDAQELTLAYEGYGTCSGTTPYSFIMHI